MLPYHSKGHAPKHKGCVMAVSIEFTSVSKLITPNPCALLAVLISGGTVTSEATLYDGQDAASGRKIAKFSNMAYMTTTAAFYAAQISSGLFLDVTTASGGFSVIWDVPGPIAMPGV